MQLNAKTELLKTQSTGTYGVDMSSAWWILIYSFANRVIGVNAKCVCCKTQTIWIYLQAAAKVAYSFTATVLGEKNNT